MKQEDRDWLNKVLINLNKHPENIKFAARHPRFKRLAIERLSELLNI